MATIRALRIIAAAGMGIALSVFLTSCGERPPAARADYPFSAIVTFRDSEAGDHVITERWTGCEFADGNVSLSFEFRRLTHLTIAPMEWTPVEEGGNLEVNGKDVPFAGGRVGKRIGPEKKLDVRAIKALVQIGNAAVRGPLPKDAQERMELIMAPKEYGIVTCDDETIAGSISPRVVCLVGTRPSGAKHAVQIGSLNFLSVEVQERVAQPEPGDRAEEKNSSKSKAMALPTMPKQVRVQLASDVAVDLVLVKPGTFQMGTPHREQDEVLKHVAAMWREDRDLFPPDADMERVIAIQKERFREESPLHEVTLTKPFYIARCEVTQGQWQVVVGSAPWKDRLKKQGPIPVQFRTIREGPQRPAVCVSWKDAAAFAARMNERAKKEVFRLPTEAEWEYACRAGTRTRYYWGDNPRQFRDYARCVESSISYGAEEVASLTPNAWGLHDMCGNVAEWCADWYGVYPTGRVRDPVGPKKGTERVVRGGSFFGSLDFARSGSRKGAPPDETSDHIGFRIVMDPAGIKSALSIKEIGGTLGKTQRQ